MRLALLIFIIVPIVEMVILIEVGGIIGALPTVGLVVLTATVGIWLLRLQGLATLARVQEKLAQDKLPETELLEGVMLLFGGALLLTPGFVTDAVGFCCLLPVTRRPIARWIIRQGILKAMSMSGNVHMRGGHFRSGSHPSNDSSGNRGPGRIIDGEYDEKDNRR